MNSLVLFAGLGQSIYCMLLFLTALFLIMLILIQRGRGGGLSGAFGGMGGGQSAFGTKAGDTFTKITIVAATAWIVLCMLGVKFLGQPEGALSSAANNPSIMGTSDAQDGEAIEGLEDALSGDGTATDAAPAESTDVQSSDGPALEPPATSEPSSSDNEAEAPAPE